MSDLPPAVYSEADVPDYVLPGLQSPDTTKGLFGDQVYGRFPAEVPEFSAEVVEQDDAALGGLAHRRQLHVTLFSGDAGAEFDILIYTPARAAGPGPVFLGLNFFGNHTVHSDPGIILPASWCPDNESKGVVGHRATEAGRGIMAGRWPVETILKKGFGLATVYCGDIAPDDPEHVREGVLAFYEGLPAEVRGGAISAWAWGLSRAMDALATLPEVDVSRVAVVGHSRLGKAALWAGACDPRFALVVSNDSGCCGAALSRRRIGERFVHINTSFPHWFVKSFAALNERESDLPVDQHQLLALVAPRALYVASAVDDKWADPRGEYLALAAAAPAWDERLPSGSPGVDQPLHRGKLGYHIRSGGHDIKLDDWQHFLKFADQLWNSRAFSKP